MKVVIDTRDPGNVKIQTAWTDDMRSHTLFLKVSCLKNNSLGVDKGQHAKMSDRVYVSRSRTGRKAYVDGIDQRFINGVKEKGPREGKRVISRDALFFFVLKVTCHSFVRSFVHSFQACHRESQAGLFASTLVR